MAYQVEYPGDFGASPPKTGARRRRMTWGFFLLFLLGVWWIWPRGRQLLQMALIPGDPENTLAVAQTFARELGAGVGVGSAWRNFCLRILSYGTSG